MCCIRQYIFYRDTISCLIVFFIIIAIIFFLTNSNKIKYHECSITNLIKIRLMNYWSIDNPVSTSS